MLQSYSWAYMWEKNYNLKRYMHLMFIAALFIIARIWKQPRCPLTDEWIRIVVYDIYIYIYIYISSQSVLKEINSEYSLERLMLKLKLQYFGHLM